VLRLLFGIEVLHIIVHRLYSAVVVAKAFDVIFFDIITILNFDDSKKFFPRILKAVLCVDGNIGTFICMHQVCLTLSGYLGYS